ncbi:hypothetical protein EKD04_022980 [Chloroflexales bacterium ZM16-3]|nr:hypothetical protein [Chloroflexales bacterium ZM16-3]
MMSALGVGARRDAPLRFILALLFAALLLTLALAHPSPQTITVGAPGDAYFLTNFYPAESDGGGPYRWSAPGARLLLPAAHQGPVALTMRLRGAAFAPPQDLRLSLARPDMPGIAFGADTGWRIYHVLLSPGGRDSPFGDQAPLDLIIPSASPGPADPRPLGAALSRVDLRYLGPAPLGPPLMRALLIAWALGVIGWAAGRVGRSTLRPYAAAIIGAGLALWAWRDPGGFAWAVPDPPLWLLIAGTVLALTPLPPLPLRRERGGRSRMIWQVGLLLAGNLALLLPLPWRGLGALIVLGLPGWLAARALFPDEGDPLTRTFLGLCGAISIAPLLTLALHAIPGPLPTWLLLLTTDLLSAAMIGAAPHAPFLLSFGGFAAKTQQKNTLLILLIAVGVALRLTLLGGAEFQGDEARAMLLAVGVAQGDDGILLTHTKGPVEALLPAGPLILAGSGVEWVARLPFALAGVGLLLGVVVLARELSSTSSQRPASEPHSPLILHLSSFILHPSSFIALALLATDGFALGFSRIVQYQSVVLLTSAGAFWACWRFYAGAAWPARHLISAAVLLAVGLLAHYDAAMVAPSLACLVIAGGVRRGWRAREWLAGLGVPALAGGLLLASFYLPYITGPSFADTAAYLAGRAGQGDAGGPPFNNLPLYFNILSFYNAPPLVPILAIALAASLLLLPLAPGAIPLALWFGVPFLAESFLIAEPRTHFYSAHPAAALIIGMGVAWLLSRPSSPRLLAVSRWSFIALGTLWLAASLGYAQLLYLRQRPEYERSFPAARPATLRASYGDQLPEAGYFGFPHNDGWKAAAELYRSGVISGSYDTNQNRWLVGWYMRQMPRCAERPDYYLIAEAEATRYFPPGYSLLGEVTVGPTRALAIYSRAPVTGPPQLFAAEGLAAAFDARPVEPFPAAAILADTPRVECAP